MNLFTIISGPGCKSSVWVAFIFATVVSVASFNLLNAQDQSPKPPAVSVSPLETYYLKREEDGKFIPYFGMTFEQFEKAFRSIGDQTAPLVSQGFVLRSTRIVASIRNDTAQLDIELDIDLKSSSTISVPIRLSDCIFPPDESNKRLIKNANGYHVLIQGEANSSETVKLKAIKTLQFKNGRKSLEFDFPESTFTNLQIHELDPGYQFVVPSSALGKNLQPKFTDGSSIEIQGLKSSTPIVWTESAMMASSMASGSFESTLQIKVAESQVEYRSNMKLIGDRTFGAFEIRFPPSTTNVQTANQDVQVTLKESSNEWETYLFKFETPVGRYDQLQLTWTHPELKQIRGFELPNFSLTSGSLRVSREDSKELALINPLNLNQLGGSTSTGVWNATFANPDFQADIVAFQKASRETITADFELTVNSSNTLVRIKIPAEISEDEIRILTRGWSLQPSVGVNEQPSSDGILTLAPMTAPTTREIVFFQNEEGTRDSIQLGLPYIESAKIDQINVRMATTADIELLYDPQENPLFSPDNGLLIESVTRAKPLQLTSFSKAPLNLKIRLQRNLIGIELIRNIRIQETDSAISIESTIPLNNKQEAFTIAFQTAMNDNPNFLVDGVAVVAESVESTDGTFSLIKLSDTAQELKIVRTIFISPDQAAEKTQSVKVNLATILMPGTAEPGSDAEETVDIEGRAFHTARLRNILTVNGTPGLRFQPDSNWFPDDSESPAPAYTERYFSESSNSIDLERIEISEDEIFVQKAWCYTSFHSDSRLDRIVLRFQAKMPKVTFKLPNGTRMLECLLDQKDYSARYQPESNHITLEFDSFGEDHVLELQLRHFISSAPDELILQLPRTRRILWCNEIYWSLELPDNQYVLNQSANLAASYVLDWNGFFLRPVPTSSPKELEHWVSSSRSGGDIQNRNAYLFRTFGIGEGSSVRIISKRNLVLLFGLFFVALGSAVISFKFIRRPFLLVLMATAFLGTGLWYPLWFVQIMQILLLVGIMICLGIVISRLGAWLNPRSAETRIETNVPSLLLAAPESRTPDSKQRGSKSQSQDSSRGE